MISKQLCINTMYRFLSEETLVKLGYLLKMKKRLDLNNPRTFNEKIQWLKLFWQKDIVSNCADKYKVRSYVVNKQLSFILLETYGIYKNTEDIAWSDFPDNFVIKTTNSCGTNIFVKDNKFNKSEINKNLNKWLQEDYGKSHLEFHYSHIEPQILVEEYIDSDNELPQDYKFFCFNGIPKFILYIDERDINTGKKRKGFYDLTWNYLDYIDESKAKVIKNAPMPAKLKEMIEIASKLSEDFPFVRVDLYSEKNRIIFGELTFTPMGGMANYFKKGIDEKIGGYLNLPEEKIKGFNN
jgi:hypothetical protein